MARWHMFFYRVLVDKYQLLDDQNERLLAGYYT